MINPSETQWQEWQVTTPAHRLFLLRWQEIFDENTFDSWQVRTANVRTMLHEMFATLQVARSHHPAHNNIKMLIEECRASASNDITIKTDFQFFAEALNVIENTYKTRVVDLSKADYNALERLLQVYISALDSYREKLGSRLNDVLNNPPAGGYAATIYSLALALGTDVSASGYSQEFLAGTWRVLADPNNGQFLERFDKLLALVSGKQEQYECLFLIAWPQELQPAIKVGSLPISNIRPKAPCCDEERDFYSQDAQAPVAQISVSALDPFAARRIAEEALEDLFAAAKLYVPSKEAAVRHSLCLVKQNGKCYLIGPDNSRLNYVRDARNAHRDIALFLEVRSSLSASDQARLSAVLQYHKLALAAPTVEARLVNLWIALETLIGRSEGAIIEAVCQNLPPTLTTGYLPALLRAYPISFRRLLSDNDTSDIIRALNRPASYRLQQKDILDILLDVDNGSLINPFMSLCSTHPLLLHRTWRIREKMLGSPVILAKRLESHRKTLDWQLRRIYRARNHVMHSGKSQNGTRHLIQNLHSYLVVTTHNLLHDLRHNPTLSIDDAFEFRREILRVLLGALNDKKQGGAVTRQALLTPQLMLTGMRGNPSWVNLSGNTAPPAVASGETDEPAATGCQARPV